MLPYCLTVAVVALLAYAAERVNDIKTDIRTRFREFPSGTRILLICAILVLVLIAGLRDHRGTDFGAYYKGFSIYAPRLETAIRNFDEPMLPLICRILSLFTHNGGWIIMTCSAITLSLALITTYREVDGFAFASLLFVFTGCWHGSFNGVRQFLAAAIVFAGHRYIYEKKFFKYCIFVFLGVCTHRSAIIMIAPYFLLNNKISAKNIILLAAGTLMVGGNLERVFRFISFIKEEEMAMGDQAYFSQSVNILRVLANCAPAVTCLILHKGQYYEKEDTFCMNALIIHGAAQLATLNSTYLARVAIYTGIFVPMCMVRLTVLEDKRKEAIVKNVVIVLFAIFWWVDISNSSALSPYRWVL